MNECGSGLVHLPGGRPTKLHAASLGFLSYPEEEIGEAMAQQRLEISLRSSVRVQLDKDVVPERRRDIEPLAHAISGWQIVAGDLAGFDARGDAAAESQSNWTGDHQQIALCAAARRCFDAAVK